MNLEYIELSIQVFTAFLSCIYLFKYKTKLLFFLTLCLVLSCIVEVIGAYLIIVKTPSYTLYLIYSFFQFNIIAYIYYLTIYDITIKKAIVYLSLIFSLFWIVVIFNKNLFFYLIILGAINTSLFVFFYMKKLLMSDEILNYKELLPFWFSVGFIVFYLPSIPFFSLINYMQNRGLFFILNILVILMNLFIIWGLIWSKKEKY